LGTLVIINRPVVIERFLQPLLIIEPDVAAQAFPQRSWGLILVQIDVLVLQGPEKPFHEDIVQGTPLSVLRDFDSF